jgi:hypothetical protein
MGRLLPSGGYLAGGALTHPNESNLPRCKFSSMSEVHGGYSRSARKRRSRAAIHSQKMRHGDAEAAFSLLQRRRALLGIAKRGWAWRLEKANLARLAKRRYERMVAQPVHPEPDRATLALRARFGAGGPCSDAELREDECQPVYPGEQCPVCKWRWGDTEPHVIAVR